MNNSAKNNSIIYSGGIGGPANINNNIIYNMPAVNANIIYNNKNTGWAKYNNINARSNRVSGYITRIGLKAIKYINKIIGIRPINMPANGTGPMSPIYKNKI
tara:strand:+ start:261 stop:566 length:306 start_codon:yes stop_codon:yes gene_type:complete